MKELKKKLGFTAGRLPIMILIADSNCKKKKKYSYYACFTDSVSELYGQ
jgi:hypothetical protein